VPPYSSSFPQTLTGVGSALAVEGSAGGCYEQSQRGAPGCLGAGVVVFGKFNPNVARQLLALEHEVNTVEWRMTVGQEGLGGERLHRLERFDLGSQHARGQVEALGVGGAARRGGSWCGRSIWARSHRPERGRVRGLIAKLLPELVVLVELMSRACSESCGEAAGSD
jgi:hypothetical protein